jgi:hypothetical protein
VSYKLSYEVGDLVYLKTMWTEDYKATGVVETQLPNDMYGLRMDDGSYAIGHRSVLRIYEEAA